MKMTLNIFRGLRNGSSQTEVQQVQKSMLPFWPVLGSVHFIDVQSSIDLYENFLFEPFHAHASDLSKMLKAYMYSYLSDASRTTSANGVSFLRITGTQCGSKSPLRHANWPLEPNWKWCDRIKRETRIFPRLELGGGGGRLTGIFFAMGILGMLKLKEYNNINLISSFFKKLLMLGAGVQKLLQWQFSHRICWSGPWNQKRSLTTGLEKEKAV